MRSTATATLDDARAKRRKRKQTAESCPCAHSCPMKAIACPESGWESCERDDAVKARMSRLVKGRGGKLVSKRSKTSDPACSQAMSDWKRNGMTPAIAAILGKCRSKAHHLRRASDQRLAGREGRAQASGKLEKAVDRTKRAISRMERGNALMAKRNALTTNKVIDVQPKAVRTAPVAPTSSHGDRLRDIQRRATSMEPHAIDAAVDDVMRGVNATDIRNLNEDFLGASVGATKKRARDMYAKRIHDLRADADRGRMIREM